MSNTYDIKDIISAIDVLLDDKNEKVLKLHNKTEEPLLLKQEVQKTKKKTDNIPKSTEQIILQAEEYLKK